MDRLCAIESDSQSGKGCKLCEGSGKIRKFKVGDAQVDFEQCDDAYYLRTGGTIEKEHDKPGAVP